MSGPRSREGTGERALVASIRARAQQTGGGKSRVLAVGIGDDCAVLRPRRGTDVVVTTDLSLENVHFRRHWHPPQSVGHRCLARGLSDLAAMGARPEAAFLSLAVPRELAGDWMKAFLDGLMALAKQYDVPLAGGDTAQSAPTRGGLVTADIVLLGSVLSGRSLLRSGAHAGDVLYVTGTLGGAAAELRALAKSPAAFHQENRAGVGHPHLYPEPRLAAGRKLLQSRWATAAIDVSDGLSTDLAHLCEESGLSAEVEADAIPVGPGATLKDALHGGEDYELLFTAAPGKRLPPTLGGVAVHAIGLMKKRGRGPTLMLRSHRGPARPIVAGGWEHFR